MEATGALCEKLIIKKMQLLRFYNRHHLLKTYFGYNITAKAFCRTLLTIFSSQTSLGKLILLVKQTWDLNKKHNI